jgi:hypothetical protein
MSDFNGKKVLKDMLSASQAKAGAVWGQAKGDFEEEFKILVSVGARIVSRKAAGTISEVNARFLMAQYCGAARSFLYSLEGIANLIIESIINAALEVLREAIKTATSGWVLI